MADRQKKPKLNGKVSVLRLIRSHWRGLSLALAAVLGETVTDVLQPWPIKVIVDSIVQSKKLPHWLSGTVTTLFGADKHAILNFAVAAVAAIAVLGAISSYVEKYMTTSISQWIAHDLRRTLYDHIQRLSLAEHDGTSTGDLISRVTDDIEAVRDFINSAMLGMLVDALTLAGMIAVMFYVSWRFTLIALSIVPPLFAVVYSLTRRIKKASRDVRKKESELTSIVEEGLNSIRVVKAYAREDYELKRFESESRESVETALRARGLKARLSPLVEVTVAAGTCLVLWYGARGALSGQISAGVLIVFLLYLDKMYKPMRDLSKETDTVSKALVGYDRIQEVLGIESRVRDMRHARRAPRFKGTIEFEHVAFQYEGGAPIFNDISFKVEPGQVAALVGPSGTGKTTIVSLIPRFYDPVSGIVKIDGKDIRGYKLQSLREQISFILQDTLLFHATVAENIAYGKPGAKEKEIIKAAQLANAAEFIEQMPQGYATMVGERGLSLSGGQRQRIAIARAIIRNAPILLLDEPTSSLDAEAEQTVMEALYRLMAGRTCMVIAHHLSTIRRANIIFVIKDSEIVERGTHDQLFAAGGTYAELFKLQAETMSLK